MSLKKFVLTAALGCASASAGVFATMPAQAACLTSNGSNTCRTYNTTTTPNIQYLTYSDVKLQTNTDWQLSTGTPGNYSNWSYSTDNATTPIQNKTWNSFTPTWTSVSGTNYSQIFTPNTSDEFYIKVTLSDTAALNVPYDFTFISNNDGAVDANGNLSVVGVNGFTALSRDAKRVANPSSGVPGPLPVLGAAAAFGYSRKIRKAIRAIG